MKRQVVRSLIPWRDWQNITGDQLRESASIVGRLLKRFDLSVSGSLAMPARFKSDSIVQQSPFPSFLFSAGDFFRKRFKFWTPESPKW